ncbi:MAG: hypothetical protein JWR35_248 [Marmoricola sp.]|nr:hypothetical protein [Marmoricola sp.]
MSSPATWLKAYVVPKALVGLLAVAGLLLSACGSSGLATIDNQTDNHGYHGIYLPKPYVVPNIQLTDTENASYSIAQATKPLDLVFFGYTKCPDVCQIVMSTIASAVSRLGASQQKDVQVVFVTTDPGRDTVPVLQTYLAHFNPDFIGLTGSISTIDSLGKPLGIFIKKGQKVPGGGYDVTHTTNVIAVHAGAAPLVWDQNASPAQMSADIVKLLKEFA